MAFVLALVFGTQIAAAATIAKSRTISQVTTSQTSKTQDKIQEKVEEKKFSFDIGLSNSQNLMESSQYEKSNSFALELTPSYKISENSSLSAVATIVMDPKDKENPALLKATAVAWSLTNYKFSESTTLTPSLIGALPTNQVQNQNEKFYGNLGVKASLNISSVLFTALDLKLSSSIRKNFNEYTQNSEGDPLIEYSFPQELLFTYKMTPALSANLLNRYIFAKTYNASERQKFLADLSFNYQINKMWSASTGITNEGDAFKADGVQSNYRLFNAETTEVYIGLGISI